VRLTEAIHGLRHSREDTRQPPSDFSVESP